MRIEIRNCPESFRDNFSLYFMENKHELLKQKAGGFEEMPAPEIGVEKEVSEEKELERKEKPKLPEEKIEQPDGLAGASQTPIAEKSLELKKIEDILEEDIEDFYFNLPPQKQQEFKQKGEETAGKIEELLRTVKVNMRKIIGLIKSWLQIIPGVNKHFLEQESKIKADKILKIKK